MLLAGLGNAYLDGGDDFDTVSYERATDGVVVDLADPSMNAGLAAGHTYSNIEQFNLSSFDDVFVGSDNGDIVHGGNGVDILLGYGGSDTLDGGNDNDWLNGGAGADVLSGGDGYDVASYGSAASHVSIDLNKPSLDWTGDAKGDVFTSIEEIDLTDFADTFIAASDAVIVHFTDLVFDKFAGETVDGGEGFDKLVVMDNFMAPRQATFSNMEDLASGVTDIT